MEDLISIIIPVYNVEQYLRNTVDSVLKQSYKNLEILLIDDGSTDQSGKICDEIATKDSRIKVIHKANGGLSSARNMGIETAQGEYIAFLDSDDYIIPDTYEYLWNLIKANNVDISEAEFVRINMEDQKKALQIISEMNEERKIEEKIISGKEILNILYGIKEGPYVQQVIVCNKLYRRDRLKDIRFPQGKLHEDEFTTYKIFEKCEKICISNKVIHGYMQTEGSIMRKEISMKRVKDNLEAYDEASDFFAKKQLTEIEPKVRRKYLEYCIELSGKIELEETRNKKEKLEYIEKKFRKFYQDNIEKIKKATIKGEEKDHIDIIEEAYESGKLSYFWEQLKKQIK